MDSFKNASELEDVNIANSAIECRPRKLANIRIGIQFVAVISLALVAKSERACVCKTVDSILRFNASLG